MFRPVWAGLNSESLSKVRFPNRDSHWHSPICELRIGAPCAPAHMRMIYEA
jgi:hypothetical protein